MIRPPKTIDQVDSVSSDTPHFQYDKTVSLVSIPNRLLSEKGLAHEELVEAIGEAVLQEIIEP